MAINGDATIRIFELNCQATYTVTAGGTLDGTLVGPRSSHGIITTGDCMVTVAPTTSIMTGKILSIYKHAHCVEQYTF